MQQKFLGDSYDIVKRFWADRLSPLGRLYAHDRFIPAVIRAEFTALTTIPVANEPPTGNFGLLFDPDTGVQLPSSCNKLSRSHAPVAFIAKTFRTWKPEYGIVFDQSYHRRHELSRVQQRKAKLSALKDEDIFGFYFVSHAPFLFCAAEEKVLGAIVGLLKDAGLPDWRMELWSDGV